MTRHHDHHSPVSSQGTTPSPACKFCGRDLSTDRVPALATRIFGQARAQRELDLCHARGMCFTCGMSP